MTLDAARLWAENAKRHGKQYERHTEIAALHARSRADALYQASYHIHDMAILANLAGLRESNLRKIISQSPLRREDLSLFGPAMHALMLAATRPEAKRFALEIVKHAPEVEKPPAIVLQALSVAKQRLAEPVAGSKP